MKKLTSIITGLFLANLTWGQTINVQTGVSISDLSYKIKDMCMCPGEQYQKKLIGYSEFVGVDYFNRKYIDISANLGVTSQGGTDPDQDDKKYYQILNYASINTMVNVKYPIADKIIPYLNVGPRADILLYNNQYNFYRKATGYDFNKIPFGFLFGGGLKYEFNKFKIGILYDKYVNFIKIAHIPSYNVYVSTSTINLTIGYNLK